MFDTLIKNGLIADGTGSPLKRSDLAVKDGRIAELGETQAKAARIIDAEGLVIAPGFIDIHSHTDEVIIIEPAVQSKITQGITTEVSGNCGSSSAPVLDEASRTHLDRWRDSHGVEENWTTMGEFLNVLEKRKFAVNFATYVGHSNIRSAVVGCADKLPTSEEIKQMQALIEQSMVDGAFGLSTGLEYAPSCFADTGEIVELAKAIRSYGGVYASHIRSERDELVESVEEAIAVGQRAGVPVQISHHKACGKSNWGKVQQTLQIIDKARIEGLDVTCDQYPYLAGATGLTILMPKWALDGGGTRLLERLKSKDTRTQIELELKKAAEPVGWIANDNGWESVVVSGVATEANKRFEGMNLLQISKARGADAVDTVINLLVEEELRVGVILFSQCEEDMQTVMQHPAVMVGTDATARALSGPMSLGKPHPRSYGTFPRILGRYVRELGLLSLEQAVAKMTSLPAAKLCIADRGVIKPGAWADLTVFDPQTVIDTATYKEPHQVANGIKYVVVNGEVALEDGLLTGALAGKVLRKSPANRLRR